MKTIISFKGVPNSGKTTSALFICAELKLIGHKCDFVPEVARELIYQYGGFESKPTQLLISGKQIQRITDALAVQNIIVTDTDVELGANFITHNSEEYLKIIQEEYKRELAKVSPIVQQIKIQCDRRYSKTDLVMLLRMIEKHLITKETIDTADLDFTLVVRNCNENN